VIPDRDVDEPHEPEQEFLGFRGADELSMNVIRAPAIELTITPASRIDAPDSSPPARDRVDESGRGHASDQGSHGHDHACPHADHPDAEHECDRGAECHAARDTEHIGLRKRFSGSQPSSASTSAISAAVLRFFSWDLRGVFQHDGIARPCIVTW
jgi:hypothetical protein